jgi:hypothetical protein
LEATDNDLVKRVRFYTHLQEEEQCIVMQESAKCRSLEATICPDKFYKLFKIICMSFSLFNAWGYIKQDWIRPDLRLLKGINVMLIMLIMVMSVILCIIFVIAL